VINYNYGYVHSLEDFEFIDGIFDVAKYAYTHNYKIIVITNQAGIGRGYYTEKQFYHLTDWMCQRFLKQVRRLAVFIFPPITQRRGLEDI